jgi:hypothetical protein
MPQLLSHIDAIARQKGRDVLFVRFGDIDNDPGHILLSLGGREPHDWKNDPNRTELIAWLDKNLIGWCPCGHFASENYMCSYRGDIYLDVPYERTDPIYIKISHRLENPDETRKITGVSFCCLSLETAMENAHHDEPGFWEKWAENF